MLSFSETKTTFNHLSRELFCQRFPYPARRSRDECPRRPFVFFLQVLRRHDRDDGFWNPVRQKRDCPEHRRCEQDARVDVLRRQRDARGVPDFDDNRRRLCCYCCCLLLLLLRKKHRRQSRRRKVVVQVKSSKLCRQKSSLLFLFVSSFVVFFFFWRHDKREKKRGGGGGGGGQKERTFFFCGKKS